MPRALPFFAAKSRSPKSRRALSGGSCGLQVERLESRWALAADFGALRGTVFNDADSDGTLDAGETGFQGISVQLTGTNDLNNAVGPLTSVTDANGRYSFTGLRAGNYVLTQLPPPPTNFNPTPGFSPINVTLTAAQVDGTSGPVIDMFGGVMQTATATNGGTNSSTIADPAAIGGNRDLFVESLDNPGEATISSNLASNPGNLTFDPSNISRGHYLVTWDGDTVATTDAAATLNATGLGSQDFTAGGTITALRMVTGIDGAGQTLEVRVYTDATNFSRFTVNIPDTGGPVTDEVVIPFASFVAAAGAGANFANVGAVQIEHSATLLAADGGLDTVQTIGPEFQTVNFPNTTDLNLSVTKTVNDATPALNGTSVFTITVLNEGPSDASGVQLTDQFPAGLTVINSVPSQGTFNPTTGIWQVGSLVNGASATLQVTTTVTTIGQKVNNVSITAVDQRDSDPTDNTASATVVPEAIDLSVTKTVSAMMPTVGSQVTYTIAVSNAGPNTATGVQLMDVLATGLTFVSSATANGAYDSTTGVWTLANDLGVGGTATLTIVATVTTTNKITNTSQITAANLVDLDSTPNNGVATEDDQASVMIMPQVAPAPAINLIKTTNSIAPESTTGGPTVLVGTLVTFTYRVTNTGNIPLSTVRVSDDNGTANNTADDFFATFVSGDTDGDNALDLTETWIYTATRVATAGTHINRATATGLGNNTTVNDPSVSNHNGIAPPAVAGKRAFLGSFFRFRAAV